MNRVSVGIGEGAAFARGTSISSTQMIVNSHISFGEGARIESAYAYYAYAWTEKD
jgi:hypothetical protein